MTFWQVAAVCLRGTPAPVLQARGLICSCTRSFKCLLEPARTSEADCQHCHCVQAGSEALGTLWVLSRLTALQLSDVIVELNARRLNAGLRHLRWAGCCTFQATICLLLAHHDAEFFYICNHLDRGIYRCCCLPTPPCTLPAGSCGASALPAT